MPSLTLVVAAINRMCSDDIQLLRLLHCTILSAGAHWALLFKPIGVETGTGTTVWMMRGQESPVIRVKKHTSCIFFSFLYPELLHR
jgi:hypothetical protein